MSGNFEPILTIRLEDKYTLLTVSCLLSVSQRLLQSSTELTKWCV